MLISSSWNSTWFRSQIGRASFVPTPPRRYLFPWWNPITVDSNAQSLLEEHEAFAVRFRTNTSCRHRSTQSTKHESQPNQTYKCTCCCVWFGRNSDRKAPTSLTCGGLASSGNIRCLTDGRFVHSNDAELNGRRGDCFLGCTGEGLHWSGNCFSCQWLHRNRPIGSDFPGRKTRQKWRKSVSLKSRRIRREIARQKGKKAGKDRLPILGICPDSAEIAGRPRHHFTTGKLIESTSINFEEWLGFSNCDQFAEWQTMMWQTEFCGNWTIIKDKVDRLEGNISGSTDWIFWIRTMQGLKRQDYFRPCAIAGFPGVMFSGRVTYIYLNVH